MNLDPLHWELSVLSRAVAFKNLSGASSQIGISQPQLSRIVSRIEQELKVVLLDRTSRRKSSWTPSAFALAETYSQQMKQLSSEIQRVIVGAAPSEISIGSLEGLSDLALRLANRILLLPFVKIVHVLIYDLNQLEEFFFKSDLDIAFTSREPGRRKYHHLWELGSQAFLEHESTSPIEVLSSFEYQNRHISKSRKKEFEKRLVSNSLHLRKQWIHMYGGKTSLPGSPQPEILTRSYPVNHRRILLIAQDELSPKITRVLEDFKISKPIGKRSDRGILDIPETALQLDAT